MSEHQSLQQTLARKRREVFLKVLTRTGKVVEATKAIGLKDATALYAYRQKDEEFAAQWDAAILASADILEAACWDRAVDGVRKPLLFRGQIVAHEQVFSDSLAIEMLRARRPEYRKAARAMIEADVKVQVGVAVIPMVAADPKAWEAEARVVHDAQKQLPKFTEPAQDAEFEEVQASGGAKSPQQQPQQRELQRG